MVNLGVITTELEKEHMKAHPPLPEDWYKTCNFVSDKEEEPKPYKLFFDYMIGGAIGGGLMSDKGSNVMQQMVSLFSKMPPFTILVETKHPKRGLEYVRIDMMPFGLKEGAPEPGSNEEPEIILRMDYYDLVRLFTGEINNFIDPICDGLAEIDGDLMVFAEFEDAFAVFETMFGMSQEDG